MNKIVIAVISAALVAVFLAGCSRTVTVTAKYRSWTGIYLVCDGSGSLNPCRKGHVWAVPKDVYNRVVVGKTYTI